MDTIEQSCYPSLHCSYAVKLSCDSTCVIFFLYYYYFWICTMCNNISKKLANQVKKKSKTTFSSWFISSYKTQPSFRWLLCFFWTTLCRHFHIIQHLRMIITFHLDDRTILAPINVRIVLLLLGEWMTDRTSGFWELSGLLIRRRRSFQPMLVGCLGCFLDFHGVLDLIWSKVTRAEPWEGDVIVKRRVLSSWVSVFVID